MASYFRGVRVAGSFVLACALAAGVAAQTPTTQKPVPKVKSASAVPISSVDGRDNFTAYCVVCHGQDGKGNGPAAPAMKVPVPDLTTIAARNQGKFEPLRIEALVRGTNKMSTPAHGVEKMPIWGDVFQAEDRGVNKLRIGNLVKYLESIQQPVTGSDPQ